VKTPSPIKTIEHQTDGSEAPNPFAMLTGELSSALSLYWSAAARVLNGSGITLRDPTPEFFSLENNFFSALFLYSYYRANIAPPRRILYAAINQCLRGMVTGCDNILDDEYKKTLETDLPPQATRIRSILDIMVSDRVLFELLLQSDQTNGLTHETVLAVSSASLRALAGSGKQEASEEGGIGQRLAPETVLCAVHHYKTGLLFQAPWAVPAAMESLQDSVVTPLLEALYRIGIGCQIMDDMVDLPADLRQGRHNYVASLIYHDPDPAEWTRLQAGLASDRWREQSIDLLAQFGHARRAAAQSARYFLEAGTRMLFATPHQYLVEPTISFLAGRLRADRFLADLAS